MTPKLEVLRYLTSYVTQDGGGKLEVSDEAPAIEGTLTRTINENPILFLVSMAYEAKKAGELDPRFYQHYLNNIRSNVIEPGLYSRRKGDAKLIPQSHDNILAIAAGASLFDSAYGSDLLEYGRKNLYNYNVATPGKFAWNCQLLGMDVACLQMAAGKSPSWSWTLWLFVSLFMNHDAGNYILAELRIQIYNKVRAKVLAPKRWLIDWAIKRHLKARGPLSKYFKEYYSDKSHPIITIQEYISQ